MEIHTPMPYRVPYSLISMETYGRAFNGHCSDAFGVLESSLEAVNYNSYCFFSSLKVQLHMK